MELAIRIYKATVGVHSHRFTERGGRLVRQGTGVVRADRSAVKAQDAVAARRRLEREAFGVIGLGGRGLFS